MSTLTFVDTHNMVAFLAKPAKSDGFHEIIDFLNANQIRYALTVNPTIYTSCIEQFWATAKAKTVNGERGTDCLPTATIFKELARMGAKSIAWNKFSSTMASLIICLATNQNFNMSRDIFDALVKHLDGGVTFDVSTAISTREARNAEIFDINDIHGDEVNVDMPVGEKHEQSVKEREVNTSVEDSAAPTTIEEITLAQTLIQIKAAKPKFVTIAATTTTTTTRPKLEGLIELKFLRKEKNQVAHDEDLARNDSKHIDVEAELKKHLVIVKDDDIAKLMLFHLLSNHQMLQDIDREDLKTLWKLVKTKHGDSRPEDEYERVLGLQKSIDQSDLKCCESASNNGNNESDPENSIWRIDSANTSYPVTQGTTKRDDVKSEYLYSASANEINEKKPKLKNLPQHLEYAYLHGDKSFPIIISSKLSEKEKISRLHVLEKRKGAIAWKMSDIKGISPSYCTHNILMEDDYKPVIQPQRRLNLKVQDVVKNEIMKLLVSGLIYPILDTLWVSPIHVVPKKGGMIVVLNDKNELIPSRTVTGWRVCIDYRKLNDAT
ncbi:hypothetical protein Tco_1118741 [Tanacetum coccineum]